MDVPPGTSSAFDLSPERILGDWRIGSVSGVLPGGVAFLLERETDGATLQVIVGPKGSEALLETSAGAVHYRKFSGLGEAEAAETARREKNKRHAAAVNCKAMEAFVSGGIPEELAKLAVTMIAKRQIPAVSISY